MRKHYLLLLTLSIILVSCGKDKNLVDSEQTVLNLFKSIKESNADGMKKHYPKISTFDSYFKSDSIKITGSNFANDSLITVSTINYFTNAFGKQSTNEIELYLVPDSLGNYSMITDSKGLTDHSENELYNFAVKTGCIEKTDSTDQQKNRKYIDAYLLQSKYTFDKLLDFQTNVDIVDWSWKTGYSGSASGKGIVKNNTTFDIPNVKYNVTYKDRNGNTITTDNGYVTYGILRAGGSESFTFYTSYVGNRASKASISLNFDEDMVRDYVLSANYNGDEYEKYLSEKSK
jgi:hypothetical protein